MGMSYTTGDFHTNGTSGLGSNCPRMNGVGAMVVKNDFGAMGAMGFSIFGVDVGAEATKLYQQTVANLQSQATKEVQKQVQNIVVKLTGQNGQVQNVTLTPEQAAQYQQTGTLPPSMIPAGFVVPQPSFMDQYGKYIMIGGGVIAGLIAISLIVKMAKK
jgi:hypothetical protein